MRLVRLREPLYISDPSGDFIIKTFTINTEYEVMEESLDKTTVLIESNEGILTIIGKELLTDG